MPSGCAPIPTSFISITTSSSDRPLRDSLPNWGPRESSMSKPGLDGRHRNKDGEISGSPTSELYAATRKSLKSNEIIMSRTLTTAQTHIKPSGVGC